jgi:nucleotide-binding universal stress UspA family protein
MQLTKERAAAEAGPRAATYATILVHAEPGTAASSRVETAARLARDLDATLVGLGAETFDATLTPDPFIGYASGEWIALVQDQIGKDLVGAEAAFRRDAAGAAIEWRSVQDYPAEAIARAAHAVDLIVVSPRGAVGVSRSADPADVVMSAGRPVLVVPPNRQALRGEAVVVAWKDSRECRRALSDALPFLGRAQDVIVLAVTKPDDVPGAELETSEVVAHLRRHGITARAMVSAPATGAYAEEIARVAAANDADLIVCGAYGHTRLREWAFGGVTDALIHRPPCFVLMTH